MGKNVFDDLEFISNTVDIYEKHLVKPSAFRRQRLLNMHEVRILETHTATIIVKNMDQPIDLYNTDAEISMTKIWLK